MASYYVKNGGNDSANGLSDGNAWANHPWMAGWTGSVTLGAGDIVYLNRGDEWHDTITIATTGTVTDNISIDAYGTGDKPLLNGFTTITGWTDYGSGIYSKAISCSGAEELLIDDVRYEFGRYPKSSFLTIDSHTTYTTIVDAALNSSVQDWTGGEVVVRKGPWDIDRCTITSHVNQTLNLSGGDTGINLTNGYGYFIQRHIDTLTTFGDWYHNGTTLYVYFGEDPTLHTTKLSTLDNAILFTSYKHYINISNIAISGFNEDGIYLYHDDNITIDTCDISYIGLSGIRGEYCDYLNVSSCTINECDNRGIFVNGWYNDYCYYYGNTVSNCGIKYGHGPDANDNKGGGMNIIASPNAQILHNVVSNCGYNGVSGSGANIIVKWNYINNVCVIKHDGGCIYLTPTVAVDGSIIEYNICLNAVGITGIDQGSPTTTAMAEGIYLDDYNNDVTIRYNTCANNAYSGIKIHKGTNNVIDYNTCYNNNHQIYYQNSEAVQRIYGNSMNYNKFIAKSATQLCLRYYTLYNDIPNYGTASYNYYARPINQTTNGDVFYWNLPTSDYRTLAEWQSFTSTDATSNINLGGAVASEDDIHFIYNETTSDKYYLLSSSMKDVANTSYSGTITLEPWESLVLIGEGTVTETSGEIVHKYLTRCSII